MYIDKEIEVVKKDMKRNQLKNDAKFQGGKHMKKKKKTCFG